MATSDDGTPDGDDAEGPDGRHVLASSHAWEVDPGVPERLADRADDPQVGAQDKRMVRAAAFLKLPRDRAGNPLPLAIAHEVVASELAMVLELSVNEVLIQPLDDVQGEALGGGWGSLHCLVPEPYMRLEELPAAERDAIWSGADRTILVNDHELRSIRLFDALILNGDRHQGNVLVSGGRVPGRRWAYFIDHGHAFAGPLPSEQQLADLTAGRLLKPYVESRATMQALWDGLSDEDRDELLPLARRIADLEDEMVRDVVDSLPGGVAGAAAKRFMLRVIRHGVSIVRSEIE
jgi:hypothetical protein